MILYSADSLDKAKTYLNKSVLPALIKENIAGGTVNKEDARQVMQTVINEGNLKVIKICDLRNNFS